MRTIKHDRIRPKYHAKKKSASLGIETVGIHKNRNGHQSTKPRYEFFTIPSL
jgi:hypothetical protein